MTRQNWPVFNTAYLARRELLMGAAVSSAAAAANAGTAPIDEISHGAESIHQERMFKADRRRVYEALTDARKFGRVVQLSAAGQSMSLGNKPTEISKQVGGEFILFGGHIVGRHLELLPNERIVQAWRVVDWSPGVYSIARFELTQQGSGTRIVLDHTSFPQGLAQHLASGWTTNYWEPLQKYLAL